MADENLGAKYCKNMNMNFISGDLTEKLLN